MSLNNLKLNGQSDQEKESSENGTSSFPMLAKKSYRPSVTEVLPHLYIGTSTNAHEKKLLESLNIKALLCLKEANYEKEPDGFEYMFQPMRDDGSTDIQEYISNCIDYIHDMRTNEKNVLVYCRGGVNRSVIVVMVYLMTYEKMNLHQSYEHIYKLRPQIEPKKTYIAQLEKIEKSLFGSNSEVTLHNLPANERIQNYKNENMKKKTNSKESPPSEGDEPKNTGSKESKMLQPVKRLSSLFKKKAK